ncbi:hypothetical protein AB0B25_15365 [Nocardia sp. NPDC049190]|uniref:hypothetical protein n=1 Tax=Nocardia sp. NPDC049190 TaxID=3155650 RepID=UPI0033D66504
MVQPTPWQAGRARQLPSGPPSQVTGVSACRSVEVTKVLTAPRPLLASLRGNAGYLCAAVGSVVTLFLLFKPWAVGSANDGKILADAFGGFQISSNLTSIWSGSPPPAAKVEGTWAVLACVAIVVTLCAVLVNLRARAAVLAHVAAGSALALAAFTVTAVVHMNGKLEEIRAMVTPGSPRDMGTQIGLAIRWAAGNGAFPIPGLRPVTYSTASLTTSAWLAGALSVVSAVAAVAQWFRGRTSSPVRRRWHFAAARSAAADECGCAGNHPTPGLSPDHTEHPPAPRHRTRRVQVDDRAEYSVPGPAAHVGGSGFGHDGAAPGGAGPHGPDPDRMALD